MEGEGDGDGEDQNEQGIRAAGAAHRAGSSVKEEGGGRNVLCGRGDDDREIEDEKPGGEEEETEEGRHEEREEERVEEEKGEEEEEKEKEGEREDEEGEEVNDGRYSDDGLGIRVEHISVEECAFLYDVGASLPFPTTLQLEKINAVMHTTHSHKRSHTHGKGCLLRAFNNQSIS